MELTLIQIALIVLSVASILSFYILLIAKDFFKYFAIICSFLFVVSVVFSGQAAELLNYIVGLIH